LPARATNAARYVSAGGRIAIFDQCARAASHCARRANCSFCASARWQGE